MRSIYKLINKKMKKNHKQSCPFFKWRWSFVQKTLSPSCDHLYSIVMNKNSFNLFCITECITSKLPLQLRPGANTDLCWRVSGWPVEFTEKDETRFSGVETRTWQGGGEMSYLGESTMPRGADDRWGLFQGITLMISRASSAMLSVGLNRSSLPCFSWNRLKKK